MELSVGPGEARRETRVNAEGDIRAQVAAGGSLVLTLVDVGDAGVARTLEIDLDGEGAEATVRVARARSGGAAEESSRIRHKAGKTKSRLEVANVLGGTAAARTEGRVVIDAGAKKADAGQRIRSLLLSDTAKVTAKPELEIYEGDVSCTHGAAVGATDDDAERLLCARGIPEEEARALLRFAFLRPLLADAGEEIQQQVREALTHL